jgi:hypothetical protein
MEMDAKIQHTFFRRLFVQRGFDYTLQNECDQLFVERRKFDIRGMPNTL